MSIKQQQSGLFWKSVRTRLYGWLTKAFNQTKLEVLFSVLEKTVWKQLFVQCLQIHLVSLVVHISAQFTINFSTYSCVINFQLFEWTGRICCLAPVLYTCYGHSLVVFLKRQYSLFSHLLCDSVETHSQAGPLWDAWFQMSKAAQICYTAGLLVLVALATDLILLVSSLSSLSEQ